MDLPASLRKWGVWNAYNRVPIILKAGDTTAGWTIGGGGSGAFRALNGLAANSLTTFSGLPEQTYDFSSYLRASFTGTTSQTAQFYSSIGVNTAITAAGIVGTYGTIFGSGVFGNFTVTDVANGKHFLPSGTIGINVITHIEAYTVSGASAPAAVAGGEAYHNNQSEQHENQQQSCGRRSRDRAGLCFIQPWEGLWLTAKVDKIGTGRPVTVCYGETEASSSGSASPKSSATRCWRRSCRATPLKSRRASRSRSPTRRAPLWSRLLTTSVPPRLWINCLQAP
jgi:hypothetical protein